MRSGSLQVKNFYFLQLNTDFTGLTDRDYHKAKGSFSQDGFSAFVSASDGVGNVTMLNVYPTLKGAIRTSWSEDFFKSVNEFYVGTCTGAEISRGLYIGSDGPSGDDSRDMFIRLINRHGRCMDFHIYFMPNNSVKLAAYVQQDDGSFAQAWTLG